MTLLLEPELTPRAQPGLHPLPLLPMPPNDEEVWSYVQDDGKRFLQFSSLSRICLGLALVFLSLHGTWLLLLLPFAAAVVVGGVINMIWSTQVPPFDRLDHLRRVAATDRAYPSVDVFICTCGEDPLIVENTICHATNLEYPGEVTVYVLDDRSSSEVHQAALRWGAQYIVRPRQGWMKKAGNIHHGYAQSSGDLILILDADFAVRRDFLQNSVPYFDDPKLGILQTPQYFRVSADNWVERGAASQQEQFYRVGMRARDKHGGAICVGTNAVYRRSALDERGGMALLEHSEDIFTGMKIIDAGYRVDYLPLPLAAGSAPDNAAALASQQYRWARGNFALAGTPLFKRMRLTPMQRLGLWDGWIYYVTSALSPVVAIFVPIVSLVEAPHLITLAPAAMVLPALFTEFYLQPRWLHMPDGRASRRVGLVSQVAHLYALRDHLTDRDQEWIPTGGKRPTGAKKGTDRIPDQITATAAAGFVIIMALLAYRIGTGWSMLDLAPVGVLAAIALPAALGTTKPPVTALKGEIVSLGEAGSSGRDAFLDVVRTVSIIRVMLWHAFGFWWISWAFAAMPAVFYVSGAVMAKSLLRSGTLAVVGNRLKRLLLPYYAFVLLGLGLVWMAHSTIAEEAPLEVLSWLVPYRAPAPLAWEQGWISTPLWFLRALVLILAFTPIVRPIARRLPGWFVGLGWLASLYFLDQLIAAQTTALNVEIARGVADVVCFGGFFGLGIAGHHLRGRFNTVTRAMVAAALFSSGVLWAVLFPPTGWVVNNSYVLFGLVGLAWLAALLAVEDQLRHLGEIPPIRRLVDWFTDNAMSIYLWHSLAIVFTYQLIGAPRSLGDFLVFGGVAGLLLTQVVAAVRPLESLGTRRAASVRPAQILALTLALAAMATRPALFPELTDVAGPPTPSGRPLVGDDDATPAVPNTQDEAAMERSAAAWLDGHDVSSLAVVEIGEATGGQANLVTFGDDTALDPNETFEAMSATKTMVAAAALQLVEDGLLTLDDPLPRVPGLPPSATGQLTLRRLLSHSTGMKDYRTTPGFDHEVILTPTDAVLRSLEVSDLGVTTSDYSASNYLLAGLVIEEVTGLPLSEVLETRLFEPLAMNDTELVNNQRAGFIGHASGGVVSTLPDLARWYDALMRERIVLSSAMFDELLFGGMDANPAAGLGTWRHCPCKAPTTAEPEPFLYAYHDGGDIRLVYIPTRDVVMAMRFSKPLYDADQLVGDIDDVIFAVADRRNPTP